MPVNAEVRRVLLRGLETHYGLVTLLYARGVLTHAQFLALTRCEAHAQRVKVVELLLNGEGGTDEWRMAWLRALCETGQRHLAAFVTSGGAWATLNNDERPLSDDQCDWFKRNTSKLIEAIDPNMTLLDALHAGAGLRSVHKASIESRRLDWERKVELLAVLQRRSCADVIKFFSCLRNVSEKKDLVADIFASYMQLAQTMSSSSGQQSRVRQITGDSLSMQSFTDQSSATKSKIDSPRLAKSLAYELGPKAVSKAVMNHLTHSSLFQSIRNAKERIEILNLTQHQFIFPNDGQEITADALYVDTWIALADVVTVGWKTSPASDTNESLSYASWLEDARLIQNVYKEFADESNQPLDLRLDWEERYHVIMEALIRLGLPVAEIEEYKRRALNVSTKVDAVDTCIRVIDTEHGIIRLMPRHGWQAITPALPLDPLPTPVRFVIVSVSQEKCSTTAECCAKVRNQQRYYIDIKNWGDIAFNFLVAPDGVLYEGRGWDSVGATALGWNRKSLGIAFLAVPAGEIATEAAFQAMERFLLYLVDQGKLQDDYTVYGLRQVRPMFEAPCLPIYTRMKTWPHWKEYVKSDTS